MSSQWFSEVFCHVLFQRLIKWTNTVHTMGMQTADLNTNKNLGYNSVVRVMIVKLHWDVTPRVVVMIVTLCI